MALEKRIAFDGAAAAHAERTLHVDAGLAKAGASDGRDGDRVHAAPKASSADGIAGSTRDHDTNDRAASSAFDMSALASSFGSVTHGPAASHEIVFIDASVPDVASLLKGISPQAEVIMINPGQDGVDQIAADLQGRHDITAIHIISHGSEANLLIGTADLNATTMQTRYAADLAIIKEALAPNADILVYGCDFAKGADGDAAAHELAALTGANVAASTDLTGSSDLGGNFVLEDQIGAIHTATIDPSDYEGVLAAAPTTVFADTGTGLHHQNVEFLTFANTPMATGGITNGATATYNTAEGGTVTITFSNVVNPSYAATFLPSDLASYTGAKFATGYNASASTSEALYGGYNGTSSFTVTFTAVNKAGVAYNPNVAFIDAETTDGTEALKVTTTGGAFQNVETVGSTGYGLTGAGTTSITLQNTTGTGVPLLVSDGTSSFNIAVTIASGKEAFALALIVPSLDLDADNSSGATGANYQTTFTERGAAVGIADTDTIASEPGLTNAASAKVVLTNAQAGDALAIGALPSGITGSIDTSTAGQITVNLAGSASFANYQSAIEAVTFASASSNPSTIDRTVNVSINDGGTDSNTAVSTIHVAAVNDAPVEVVPGAQSTNKDTALAIAGLSVVDVDANGGAETVTLSVGHGTISLASTAGLSFSAGTGSNDTSETFTGTLSAIDQAIASVTYRPTTGFFGSDSLSFGTNDNGNTGSGGALSTARSVGIAVNNVNPSRNGTLPDKTYPDSQAGIAIATASGFSDSLSLPLTYRATGLPAGLTIDASTGVISGALDHDASLEAPATTGAGASLTGKYAVVVTADDGQSGTTTQAFTIAATNQAPQVGTATPNQSASDAQAVTPIATASAFSDPNAGDVLAYTVTGLPSGLGINASTGVISGTPVATASRASPYTIRVTATDDKNASATETFTMTVADVPPQASGTIAPRVIADGTPNVSIAAAGAFTNPLGLNGYSATGLPAGLTINASTGVISGTLDHDASAHAPTTHGTGAALDGTYTIVVTANDGQGGVATQTFTIDATNQAPSVATQTPNQHSYDGNVAALSLDGTFSDPNTGDIARYAATNLPTGLSIDPTTGRISGTIGTSASTVGPFHVSVTETDDKGASATETFTWVVDNVPPTATPPLPDRAVNDGNTVTYMTANGFTNPLGLAFTYSATGLPLGLSIDPNTGVISGTVDHNASAAQAGGSYQIAVTVDDRQGGTATNTFTLVSTNQAPVLGTATAARSAVDSATIASINAAAAFADPNPGDTVTYSAAGLPAGLAIDPTSGLITGTLADNASQGSPYSVHVTATDNKGAATSEIFAFTVADVPPAVANQLGDQTYPDGTTGVSIATAAGFSDSLGLPVTYSAVGLPKGLNIDAVTGVISGTLEHDASIDAPSTTQSNGMLNGVYTVTVIADDGQGGTAFQNFALHATNQPPATSAGTRTPNQVNADGDVTSLHVASAFADPNLGDIATYTASGLPSGLTIDPATGRISGTVAANASTTPLYTVSVTATDDKGASAVETFQWTIDNVPPVASPIPNQAAIDGEAVTPIDPSAHFVDLLGLPLTYTASGLPTGLAIDSSSGMITGTIDHDASALGPYTITVTGDDGQGGRTSQSFTLTSANQAPKVVAPTADQVASAGAAYTLNVAGAFTDPNPGDTVTYAAIGLPAGLSIDHASGAITGTIDLTAFQAGPRSVTIVASDDKGLSASENFTFSSGTPPPSASGSLPSQTMPDSTHVTPIATAGGFTDSRGLTLTYSATGLPVGLNIDPATGVITGTLAHDASASAPTRTGSGATLDGTYTIVVTASDGEGGFALQSFAFDATNQAPAVVAQTPDQIGANGNTATLNLASAFADPNAGDGVTYAATGLPTGLVLDPNTGLVSGTIDRSASIAGPFTVVATATDEKGAATSETFRWTINNVTPVATPPLADKAVNDGQAFSYDTSAGFTNPLGLPFTYTATGLPSGLMLNANTGLISGTVDHDASAAVPGGSYTIAVTANDGQGGQATNTFALVSTNHAPAVVNATPAQHVFAGSALTVDSGAAFADPNTGDTVTYAATGLPTSLSIDPSNGHITGVVDAAEKPGAYTVTVVATDDKHAATAETFTVAVQTPGLPPPVATAIAPVHVVDGQTIAPIDAGSHFSDPNGLPLTLSVSGLPLGLRFDPVSGTIVGTIDHDASLTGSGIYNVLVSADDGHGGVATSTFVLTSTNQAPQVVAPVPDQVVYAGAPLRVDASTAFKDPNAGDVLTYMGSGLPRGLALDQATGLLSGTVDPSQAPGAYTVAVVATDEKGASATDSFVINVQTVVPVVTGIAPVHVLDGQTIAPIDVGSHFSDPNGVALTLTVTGLPAGLVFDPASGTITGTIGHDASIGQPGGAYIVTVTASDGQGGVATSDFTLVSVNAAPAVVAATTGRSVAAGSPLRIDAGHAFADPDTGDTVTFAASGLPRGLALDPATGQIAGTVDALQRPGTYPVTITATDDKGAATTETFTVTVTNVPPVVLAAVPPVTVADGQAIAPIDAGHHFSDPNGVVLTFTATGLPVGLHIDPATGIIFGRIDHDASITQAGGRYAITVTADDGQGGVVATQFMMTSVNRPPQVVTATPDQTVGPGDPLRIASGAAFADPNSGDILTFAASGLPPGLVLDPRTGLIAGTVDYAVKPGVYTITVTATDDKGAAALETFTITVQPVPPVTVRDPAPAIAAVQDVAPPSALMAEGAVLAAVRAASLPGDTIELSVDRIVVSTVNGLRSLGGIGTLDPAHGAVHDAVIEGVGKPTAFRTDFDAVDRIEPLGRPQSFLGASFRSVDSGEEQGLEATSVNQIAVETMVRDRVIFIAFKTTRIEDRGEAVVSYAMTRANGDPLPSWLEQSRRGLVFGKLASDADVIDLKITATLRGGRTVTRSVLINTLTGVTTPFKRPAL